MWPPAVEISCFLAGARVGVQTDCETVAHDLPRPRQQSGDLALCRLWEFGRVVSAKKRSRNGKPRARSLDLWLF